MNYTSKGTGKAGYGLFGIINIIRKLYALCWSVAHIARHLGISQDEVRKHLKK